LMSGIAVRSRLTSLLQEACECARGRGRQASESTTPYPPSATRRPVRVLRRVRHGWRTAPTRAMDGPTERAQQHPGRSALPPKTTTRTHRYCDCDCDCDCDCGCGC